MLFLIKHYSVAWLCSGNLCFIFIFDGFSYLGWICKKWLGHRTLTLSGPNSKHWNLDFLIGQDLAVLTRTFCVYCNKLLQFYRVGVFRLVEMFSEYLGLWIRMGFEYLDNIIFWISRLMDLERGLNILTIWIFS